MHANYENKGEYWELISKVVTGDADTRELSLFEKLSVQNPEFSDLYKKAKEDWNLVSGYKPISRNELDIAWQKQKQRISHVEVDKQEATIKSLKIVPFLKFAASIVLIFSLSYAGLRVYNKLQSNKQNTFITERAETRQELALPDGSLITLNKDSRITYPKKFRESIRTIKLQGEAYFDVMHDAARPFIIQTQNAEIKVLGTSFNVFCDDRNARVEVFVETGKVQVTPTDQTYESLILEPGYIGIVSEQQAEMTVNKDKNYLAWKTGNIVFKEADLKEVVKTLNKIYDVNIKLNNDITNCRFTSTFSNQNLDVVLDVICTTFNLKMNRYENQILLSGEGC